MWVCKCSALGEDRETGAHHCRAPSEAGASPPDADLAAVIKAKAQADGEPADLTLWGTSCPPPTNLQDSASH